MNEEVRQRYEHRRLADVEQLGVSEIAERTGASQAKVLSDLDQTVAPAGYTKAGTPYYPKDRFSSDPDYQARVTGLLKEMPLPNAKIVAGREFATGKRKKAERPRPTTGQVELGQKMIREVERSAR